MGIILIIIFVAFLWFVLTQANGHGHGHGNGIFDYGTRGQVESPLEVLKKRYARGEIDKTEYDQRRADLE